MHIKMNFGLMENILCDIFSNSLSPVKRFFKIFGKKKKTGLHRQERSGVLDMCVGDCFSLCMTSSSYEKVEGRWVVH